ncbi:hypothetical protein Tco_0753073 [Tanacetum coccineum]
MSDTESDDTIQRKQIDKKNKRKSTESESDSDFAVGTFDKYNEVVIKKKGKRPTLEKDSDSEDAVCAKKKRKRNKSEDNMIVNYEPEVEAKVEVKAKTNDKKAINSRMSPRNLKRVLYSLTTLQKKRIESIADHTGAKKIFFCKKSVVKAHPISIVEIYSESDEESTPVVKKEKIKMVLIEKDPKKKDKLIVEDSKITKNDSRKKVKIVVTKDQDEELIDEEERQDFNSKKFQVDFNSKHRGIAKEHKDVDTHGGYNGSEVEYGKNTNSWVDNGKSIFDEITVHGGNNGSEVDYKKNTDIWVNNGKSIVPFNDSYFVNSDSSLLETKSDENNTQSVDMQFDEINVQDEVGKTIGDSKESHCHKGNINEYLGFNFLSSGLEDIEYLIPGFEKGRFK